MKSPDLQEVDNVILKDQHPEESFAHHSKKMLCRNEQEVMWKVPWFIRINTVGLESEEWRSLETEEVHWAAKGTWALAGATMVQVGRDVVNHPVTTHLTDCTHPRGPGAA
ncbi:hypothetical protein NDU88_005997 [Pleurodeles waltl]|uniref:Uncharacterized protein n=1 Tax=Pleurodeles waltl TaxID=8319 RepID=A0AAV7TWH0_PLEWA|nr:hypothetical protein NDU88_005997 [Pleurodeles waltl]